MTDYKKDSTWLSLLWGRTGAAILALIASILAGFGFTFGEEMQTQAFEAVAAILGGIAFLQVTASKIRENKKTK